MKDVTSLFNRTITLLGPSVFGTNEPFVRFIERHLLTNVMGNVCIQSMYFMFLCTACFSLCIFSCSWVSPASWPHTTPPYLPVGKAGNKDGAVLHHGLGCDLLSVGGILDLADDSGCFLYILCSQELSNIQQHRYNGISYNGICWYRKSVWSISAYEKQWRRSFPTVGNTCVVGKFCCFLLLYSHTSLFLHKAQRCPSEVTSTQTLGAEEYTQTLWTRSPLNFFCLPSVSSTVPAYGMSFTILTERLRALSNCSAHIKTTVVRVCAMSDRSQAKRNLENNLRLIHTLPVEFRGCFGTCADGRP